MVEMNCKKRLLFSLFFLTSISIFIVVTILPGPIINDLVLETHKTLENRLTSYSKNNNLKNERPDEDELDTTYLELLGFNFRPILYNNRTQKNIKEPVIVTATNTYTFQSSLNLLLNLQKHLSNFTLVIYDLGLESYETLKVKKKCIEGSNCILKHFDLSKFPSHIKDYLYTQAYLPLLLQQALTDFGCILWIGMDTDEYFNSSNLDPYVQLANQSDGLLGWSMDTQDTTSAYTHPYMFKNFRTMPDKYRFHRMLDPSHLLLINTAMLHYDVMLPWTRCSLFWPCISPVGADVGKTCVQRRPRYLFTGCHRFSISALNIILGQWDHQEAHYLRLNSSELFVSYEEDNPSTTQYISTTSYP